MSGRRSIINSAATILVLFLPGCSIFSTGKYQNIPVTANPTGAWITVDGESAGTVPKVLRLKSSQSHFIVIGKEGYRQAIIQVRSHIKGSIGPVGYGIVVGGTVLGAVVGGALVRRQSDPETFDIAAWQILGGLAGLLVSSTIMVMRPTRYALTPTEIEVTLEKAEGDPTYDILVVSSELMSAVHLIRIKCEDRSDEAAVHLVHEEEIQGKNFSIR